jgi:Ca2+-transporting ATPase
MRSMVRQGILLAVSTLAAFIWTLNASGDMGHATTVAFLTLGLAQLFHVFNSRFETGSAFKQGFFSNRAIWAALGLTILLLIAAVYLPFLQTVLKTVPSSPMEWLVVAIASLSPALLVELYKLSRA